MGLIRKSTADREPIPSNDFTVQDLSSQDPATRRRAAQTLRAPAHIAPLLAAAAQETDRAARVAIFNALRDIGGVEVGRGLTPLLASEDADTRNAAVAVMKALGKDLGQIMPDLLADRDPDIRIMAIDILQDLGHPDAPSWLAAVLEHDDHQNVVGAAIDRMVEIGTPVHCDALRKAALRFASDPFIAFATNEAIRSIESGHADEF